MQETDVAKETEPTEQKMDALYVIRVGIIAAAPIVFGVLLYYFVENAFG